jgi:hypothetical protein
MHTLREKFDEVTVYLPAEGLEEDISLVDSPGTHSINEVHSRIAEDIIPHSHLVVCMLDSQNAGNEQNREFIERVVQQCRRKMFFVINKCDQLNDDEIDESGRRGPAKDLARCLEEVVSNPEVFFTSSLYGLASARLKNGHLTLSDVDADNKIRIPFAERRTLESQPNPTQAAAAYLYERSRIERFKQRLFEYLYLENREGAIVESVCCFVDALAWKFARPLEVKLEMARHVPRLDDIAQEREKASKELERRNRAAEEVMNGYRLASAGGEFGGQRYPGYEGLVNSHLNRESVEKLFFLPLREWILKDDNFASGERSGFKALTKSLEQRLDAYLGKIQSDINNQIGGVEDRALRATGEVAPEMDLTRQEPITAQRGEIGEINFGIGASYVAFLLEGALAGAVVLGGAGYLAMGAPDLAIELEGYLGRMPDLSPLLGEPFVATQNSVAVLGALAGAVLGGLTGVLLRSITAASARRKMLTQRFCDRVDQLLLRGYRDGVGKQVPSVREGLLESVATRRTNFGDAIRKVLDGVVREVTDKLGGLRHEEEELRRHQAETIERLEPKVAHLRSMAQQAKEIASTGHQVASVGDEAASRRTAESGV